MKIKICSCTVKSIIWKCVRSLKKTNYCSKFNLRTNINVFANDLHIEKFRRLAKPSTKPNTRQSTSNSATRSTRPSVNSSTGSSSFHVIVTIRCCKMFYKHFFHQISNIFLKVYTNNEVKSPGKYKFFFSFKTQVNVLQWIL